MAAAAAPPPGATSCSGCHPPAASAETKVPPLRGQDAAAIVAAVATGELTPGEAGELSAVLTAFAKTIEIKELEERVTALEKGKTS